MPPKKSDPAKEEPSKNKSIFLVHSDDISKSPNKVQDSKVPQKVPDKTRQGIEYKNSGKDAEKKAPITHALSSNSK